MYFLFRTNGKITTDENDFRHYYSIFQSIILKLLYHSYVQSSFVTIRMHFDNSIWNYTLQLKILRTWISVGTNYFLSNFLEIKIDESAWKIIYTIIRAGSSKNIAPWHFTYCCMLLFLSNKHRNLNLTLCCSDNFCHKSWFTFFYFWYSVCIRVNPEPPCFLQQPVKLWWGSMLFFGGFLGFFGRFTAAECSYAFIFYETFVPVNGENYSNR